MILKRKVLFARDVGMAPKRSCLLRRESVKIRFHYNLVAYLRDIMQSPSDSRSAHGFSKNREVKTIPYFGGGVLRVEVASGNRRRPEFRVASS